MTRLIAVVFAGAVAVAIAGPVWAQTSPQDTSHAVIGPKVSPDTGSRGPIPGQAAPMAAPVASPNDAPAMAGPKVSRGARAVGAPAPMPVASSPMAPENPRRWYHSHGLSRTDALAEQLNHEELARLEGR